SVVLLLRAANDEAVHALTTAKHDQVQATADSFNARVGAELSAVSGLGATPWQLVRGSASDQRVLKTYDVDPNAKSGFFLIDAHDVITAGILLRPGRLGSRFEPPGWAAAKRELSEKPAVILPVMSSGLTTEIPSYELVVAIRGSTPRSVRGALVFEQALTTTSPFEQEIAQLGDHAASTAAWFFIDSRGAVVATTKDTGLGAPVENDRYRTVRSGVSYLGNRIVITADVPTIGWRVVYREQRSQFESAVTGPLQEAGLILVLLLLAIGLTLVVILVRRLREAREQERRLRELTRSQSEFISVVSHELRTPVAGVLGFLQTTVDHWSTLSEADRLNTVRRAVTNARRLQAMTRDVLDTESIESGRIGYSFQRLELGAELQTAVEGSRDVDDSHLVTLQAPGVPIVVEADPDRLQQVLSNLLENARKNSPPGEPIVVEAEVLDGPTPRVRVAVVDRGPGVDADAVDRIFEKFVRGNDNAVSGTGLGLYIVRTIVEAHHGRIWCESDPGRRTAFVFELPIVPQGQPDQTLTVSGRS
ncbi:MAG TPA: HAMP domain-containing sensor histidine kinase, partial [Mycobacterium sp.]|nr:HAMP domain-containing sensor histidine kinase [Mycobacterium sp.]